MTLGFLLVAIARMYLGGDASNLMKQPIALTLMAFLLPQSVIQLLRYPFGQYRYPGDGYSTLACLYAIILVFVFLLAMAAAHLCLGRTARDAETPALWPPSPVPNLSLVLFLIVRGLLSAAHSCRAPRSRLARYYWNPAGVVQRNRSDRRLHLRVGNPW
jgi:hypothetical protein